MKKLISNTGVPIVLNETKNGTIILIGREIKFLPFGMDKTLGFMREIGII